MNVIVSGASQGIGYETAIRFVEKGCKVIAIARNEQKLQRLAASNKGITALAHNLVHEGVEEKLGRILGGEQIDIVVNNAGSLINRPFLETSIHDFRQQFDANVLTAINLIKASSPFLKRAAHIIAISSMGGFQGSAKFPGLSAYSAAKGALSVLIECLAVEYQEKEIAINALALGAVQTEMLEKAFPSYKAPITPKEMGEYIVEFAMYSGKYMSGKILPVSINNP